MLFFLYLAHDRSHSPASQRGESPTRPPPPSQQQQQQQQQQESDFKISKDATNLSAHTSSFLQSNDQQVPSNDILTRVSNTIALEKLEQIKQNLVDLNQQVDAFNGSTRDDRNYKVLDEQALKMMIRCDELINVSVDIKEKRKEMIQNVQTVLAKLELKVPLMESNSNQMEGTLVIYDPSINNTEEKKEEETSIERST
jgi:hypothetical protein